MGKPKYQKSWRTTAEGFAAVANPARAQGQREIARSNKAGAHDSRPRRQRTRRTAAHAALREYA